MNVCPRMSDGGPSVCRTWSMVMPGCTCVILLKPMSWPAADRTPAMAIHPARTIPTAHEVVEHRMSLPSFATAVLSVGFEYCYCSQLYSDTGGTPNPVSSP